MINGKIDLRSDTVTHPTAAMRQAMFEAPVGDDVYGDDPTILQLETLAAELLGKEAALFVPTGTMSNQLALFTHTQRGEEVILPDTCHIVAHEAGAAAILSGAQLRCIQPTDGKMPISTVERIIRKDPSDIHQPHTSLITYENPTSDGEALPLSYMKELRALASSYAIPIHLDGARLFNAAAALSVSAKELAAEADTISICLSKGLCAPVGSLLVGPNNFIEKARRNRKILGGGMRQVGILAAAGILSLTKMTERLSEDHENAAFLAEELSHIPGIVVYKERQQINMVFFSLEGYPMKSAELVRYLAKQDVLINGEENGIMRFVTHYYTSREEIQTVLDHMQKAAGTAK